MRFGTWFAPLAGERRARRSRAASHVQYSSRAPRGVFEPLEARHVLSAASGGLLASFDALTFDSAAAQTQAASGPQATGGAASASHLLSIAGGAIRWQTRGADDAVETRLGSRAEIAGDASFFSALAPDGEIVDAAVRFDAFSGRFIVAALERFSAGVNNPANRSRILLAVSTTSDPFGAWHFQSIDAREQVNGTETFVEQLGLATDDKAIYVTANLRAAGIVESVGARLWIVDKTDIESGSDLPAIRYDPYDGLGLTFFPPLRPANVSDAKPAETGTYLVSAGWALSSTDQIRLVSVLNPLGNTAFNHRLVSAGDIHDAQSTFQGISQPGESARIAAGDLRVTDAVWQGDQLYVVNTTLPPSGVDAGQETVHWYRVDTSSLSIPTLADHGAIGGEELSPQTRTFGASIVPDRLGNIYISFSAAAPDLFLGSYYAAHLTTQGSGVTTWPAELVKGADSYLRLDASGANAWARGSTLLVDPANSDALLAMTAAVAQHGSPDPQNAASDGRWTTQWTQMSAGASASYVQGAHWNDADGDGIRDAGEVGLAGWTVYLDFNRNGALDAGEPRAITANDSPATPTVDERGEYAFLGLPSGSAPLRVLPNIGWSTTFPSGPVEGSIGDQDLESLVARLDQAHDDITGLISNRHDFTEGETGTSIVDGGNDMFDGGNRLNTNLATQIPYTNGAVVAGDAAFGPGSRYFTAKYPGLFVLGASGMSISEFYTDGVTGADSTGNVEFSVFDFTVQGRAYRGVLKRTYNTGDPSIQKLIIVSGATLSQTITNAANSDLQRVQNLSAIPEMYYLLFSRRNSQAISNEEVRHVAETFLATLPIDARSGSRILFGERASTKAAGTVFFDRDENGAFDPFETGLSNWTVYADLNNNQMRDSGEPSTVTRADDSSTAGVDEAGTFALLNLPSSVFSIRTVARDGWDTTSAENAGLVAISSVDLPRTLDALDGEHDSITAEVGNRYDFSEGETGYEIVSGGNDMYAGGNHLSTNLAGDIAYTSGAIQPGDAQFGPGSSYFTAKYPGLFVLGARNLAIDSFSIGGTTGNAGGEVDATTIALSLAGEPYTLFFKRNYGGGPSINQLILVRGSAAGVTQTIPAEADDDGHQLTGLAGTRELYYLLVSRAAGELLTNADATAIANAFLAKLAQSAGIPGSISIGQFLDARISGTKWNDLDADRTRDPDEPGLPGGTIYADENDNNQLDPGEPSTLTLDDNPATPGVDERGTYVLAGLQEKTYHIREVAQPEWIQRYPESQEHTVTLGRPDLEGLLGRLEAASTSITSLIPNRFDFTNGDTGTSISDGGSDMFDTGNRLRTNLQGSSNIGYTNKAPTDSDPYFGTGSRYITAKYPGLFVMAAGATNVDTFSLNGGLGADGAGQFDVATLNTVVNGRQFTLFVKRVYGAPNPSVNHIIIVPGPESLIVHATGTTTDDDFDQIAGISHVSEIYYLLFGSTNGGYVDDAAMTDIARAFLNLVQPTTSAAANIDFGNRSATAGAVLSGHVFQDADRDGTRDAGETGIEGVTIFLDANDNGKLDASEASTLTATDDPATPSVDERGDYRFVGLTAGDYIVAAKATAQTMIISPAIDSRGAFVLRRTLATGEIADAVDFAARPREGEIVVRGNGVELVSGTTSTSLAAGNAFGTIDLNGDTLTSTFSIFNSGDGPLQLTGNPSITITGSGAADFTILAQPAALISPGQSSTFVVRFDPSTPSTRTATINIASNDSSEPTYTFRVQGAAYVAGTAVANDDSFTVVEDGTLVAGAQTVVPMRANWVWFEDMTRTGPTATYPLDATPTDAWRDRGYATSTPSFGAWKGPNAAPFVADLVDGLTNPTTSLNNAFTAAGGATRVTALFRTTFSLTADQTANTNATVVALCDDGCVGYINGVEVFRARVPTGVPSATAEASNLPDENTPTVYSVDLVALGVPLFADAGNVFAIELHQGGTISTDIGFDASLAISSSTAGLLVNDSHNGAVQFNLISQPIDTVTGIAAGTVTLNADGSGNFVYTPPRDYTGTAKFRYTITDANSANSAAEARVVVTPQNDPPVARNDSYAALANRPLIVSAYRPLIEANESRWWYDDGGLDQDALNPTWKFAPAANFQPAPAGWLGPARSQLGYGDADEQTVIRDIAVTGAETAYFYSTFDTVTSPTKLILELRYDDGAAVYINGVRVISENLPESYAYDTFASAAASDDGNSFHRFEIDTAGLDLQLTGNTIAVEVHQATAESSDLSFDLRLYDPRFGLLANDEDHDNTPAERTVVDVTQSFDPATLGPLTVQPNGSFIFRPASARVNGAFQFTYAVLDSAGVKSTPATVTLNITATDFGPAIAADDLGIAQFVTTEDTPLVIDAASGPTGPLGVGLLANDAHPGEESSPLTLVIVDPPASGGTVVFSGGTGGFTYTPGANFDGIDSFTYAIFDGYTTGNTATVNILVHSVDDPPIAADDVYSVAQDQTLDVAAAALGLLANDGDADGDGVDDAQLVPNAGPQHGVLALNSDGTFQYTPSAGYFGVDSFQYTVEAGGVRSAPGAVTITVESSGGCALRGDINGDGTVDQGDVAQLLHALGGNEPSAADVDCDGKVTLLDAVLVRNQMAAQSAAPAAVVAAVDRAVNGLGISRGSIAAMRVRTIAPRAAAQPRQARPAQAAASERSSLSILPASRRVVARHGVLRSAAVHSAASAALADWQALTH
jgi:hypothetical protein